MVKEIKVTCLNCSQYCKNKNKEALIDQINELSEGASNIKIITECVMLKSLNL